MSHIRYGPRVRWPILAALLVSIAWASAFCPSAQAATYYVDATRGSKQLISFG